MAALTAQSTPHAGLAVSLTTGLGGTTGNTAPTGAGIGLLCVNVGGGAVNVTVKVPAATTVDGLVINNRVVALTASANAINIIPLPASPYADPVTGLVTFDVAAGTVSAAVVVIT
jgi:hypothetical protein